MPIMNLYLDVSLSTTSSVRIETGVAPTLERRKEA